MTDKRPMRARTAGETPRENELAIAVLSNRLEAFERRFDESSRSQGERIGKLEASNLKLWKVVIAIAAGGGGAGALIAKLIGG